jgi:branched-chain amino acid transport system substrate-binding protein
MKAFLLPLLLFCCTASGTEMPDPVGRTPAGLRNEKAAGESKGQTEIRIGMLIPGEEGKGAVLAAELAIARANESGGYQGTPFKLVARSAEGPWGAGSKESVDLVFEDNVVAILGSLDGRNAHLAEQVATKTQILFLSTWATDPTLSQAFVPWYFRCIPNAEQQAEILYHHIYSDPEHAQKTVLIHDASYDASYLAKSFIRICAGNRSSCPPCIAWKDHSELPGDLKQLGAVQKPACIVLFTDGKSFPDLLELLRSEGIDLPVFTGITDPARSGVQFPVIRLSPGFENRSGGQELIREFEKRYGHSPGVREAYAYDGMNLILESIRRAGTGTEAIRDSLAGIYYPDGATGSIRFDEYGNLIVLPASLVMVNDD